jgi:hypothetical protein
MDINYGLGQLFTSNEVTGAVDAGISRMQGYQNVFSQEMSIPVKLAVETPKVTDLARKTLLAVEPNASIANERITLASKASKLLGYKILGNSITKEAASQKAKWECAQAFLKIGFDPLDREKVNNYKAQMVASKYHSIAWATVALEKYNEAVPEFALSRAIELKELLPLATFEVEYIKAMPDPFLVMVYGAERFYVDVWDEPLFEGRRTV